MKTKLFCVYLVIGLFTTSTVSAQNIHKAFIITLENDTIHGEVKIFLVFTDRQKSY